MLLDIFIEEDVLNLMKKLVRVIKNENDIYTVDVS